MLTTCADDFIVLKQHKTHVTPKPKILTAYNKWLDHTLQDLSACLFPLQVTCTLLIHSAVMVPGETKYSQ